jgi:hypothetical protein
MWEDGEAVFRPRADFRDVMEEVRSVGEEMVERDSGEEGD